MFGASALLALLGITLLAVVSRSGQNGAHAGAPALAPSAAAARSAAPGPQTAACIPDGGPRPLDSEIHESSGVAVSRQHPGIFWTHNDSGEPVVYAVDAQGRTAGRVRVAGAAVQDWEDVALAGCPGGGDCLFLADIGDNKADREFVTVYRVPEPEPGAAESAPATPIRLRYPDGAHDAEAMFVLNGVIHVVTKGESGPIAVFGAPAGAGPEATLQRLRVISPDKVSRPERITGAAARADGRWIALRTLDEALLFPAAELVGAGTAAPRRVDLRGLDESQGEGIGFAPDGGIYVTSEGGKKSKPATFARLSCTL
jgi:hypothetical protein